MSRESTSTKKQVRTIAIEEACIPPTVLADWESYRAAPLGDDLRYRLTDFEGKRLAEMDRDGIEMSIVSLSVPGPQAIINATAAQEMAVRANDALAESISGHRDRFGAFCALAMHDVDTACREFERSVKELGFCGVLLNNTQAVEGNPENVLFYDLPQFDAFWEMAAALDVPVYLHPAHVSAGRGKDWAAFPWLRSAAWGFAANTGLHALRIITSGVFDRHPKAQLILGHLGEHIVASLWRCDNSIKRVPLGYPAEHPVRHYFRTNVHVSTSGQFSDPSLRHAIDEIGADRVMFAVDYPYEDNDEGTAWFASTPISDEERSAIARGNAIKLFKLNLED